MGEQHTVAQAGSVSGSDYRNPANELLPTDILYSIFHINADIDDERPLETARHTSQVCSLWRNVMLTAPGIWGKIIKLSELQVEKDISPWRNLVMERAGDAPLFIEGEIPTDPDRIQWFLNFLSSHWERVFHIDVQTFGRHDDFPPESTNFLINAPRSIEAFHFPRIRFDLGAPWIANLRAIGLSYPVTTSEILQVLANTPRLEHARLHSWMSDDASHLNDTAKIPPQSVVLPHLTYLLLCQCVEEVARVLEPLVPNRECEYTIQTFYNPLSRPTVTEWDVFSRCLQRRINLRSKTTLEISIYNANILFKIVGDPTMPAFLHGHSFNIGQMMDQNDLSIFLTRFSWRPSIFGRVTGLVFHAVDRDNDGRFIVLNHYVNNFKTFFSLFPSVSTLQLSQHSLRFLTEECEIENLFPALKTLELQVYHMKFDSAVETLLPRLLNQRRMCGKAIEKLCVFPKAAKSDVSWNFLEEPELHDLTVVWIPEESFA